MNDGNLHLHKTKIGASQLCYFINGHKNGIGSYLCGMEIVLLCVGKTADKEDEEQLQHFQQRLSRYVNFQLLSLPPQKINKKNQIHFQRTKEEERLQSQIKPHDYVILLDERGKQFSSMTFAQELDKIQHLGCKRIVFIVGGPYGFSTGFKQQFPKHLALSKMTFSHQMIRLFFCEQLYRAYTILNNHPYHNE